jgi:Fe-S oxidoreductase
MPRKPTGRPVGPPKKFIDWAQFEQLCALQCTQSEIASMLKIDRDTLRDRAVDNYSMDYSAIYKKYSESGKCSLRRNQFVLSKTNASLAIWLGKMWLGQRDSAIDEVKQDALNEIRTAIREILAEPRINAPGRPLMEDKQSLLDQKFPRDKAEISA